MGKPIKFQQKPVLVEAIQFFEWSDALDINNYFDARVFYVPPGYEHPLRRDNEFDGSNGHILETSQPFLLIKGCISERADVGDWIVMYSDGSIGRVKKEDMEANFERMAGQDPWT